MSQGSPGTSDSSKSKVTVSDVVPMDDASTSDNTFMSDTTAPSLSAPEATQIGASGFDWKVTTNEGDGSLHWVALEAPSAQQIKAGQDASGASAAASGSQSVVADGLQSGSGSGLAANKDYIWFCLQEDTAGNTSVSVSDGFMTTVAPTGVTLSFGDNNDGTDFWGRSDYINEPSVWGSVGAPSTLNLGMSTAVPTGGSASDFAVDGAGVRCTAVPTVGTYSWNDCYFDSDSSNTFIINVTVFANRLYIAPRLAGDTYGVREFKDWTERSNSVNDGIDLYMRGGMYDVALNQAVESGLASVNFNRGGNRTGFLTPTVIRGSDETNMPQLSRFQYTSRNNQTVQNITMEYIDFFMPQDSFLAGGSAKQASIGMLDNNGCQFSGFTVRNCVFRTDSGKPRDGAAHKYKWYGHRIGGTDVTFENNIYHDIWVPGIVSGTRVKFNGNVAYSLWGDFLQIGTNNDNFDIEVHNNLVYDWVSDGAWIHADFIHVLTDKVGVTRETFVDYLSVRGNKVFMGFEGVRQLPVVDSFWKYGNPPSAYQRSVSGNTVLSPADENFRILVDTTASDVTIVLPAASAFENRVIVQKSSEEEPANSVTVVPAGTDTVDGTVSSTTMTSIRDPRAFYSDGTSDWTEERWNDGDLDPNYEVVTASDIVLDGSHQDHLVRVDTRGGNRTVTLPAATKYVNPVRIQKFSEDTNTLTVVPSSSDTINGAAASYTITEPFRLVTFDPDVVSNWTATPRGTTSGGTQGYLAQEKKPVSAPVTYRNVDIDHNILELTTLNGIRMEGDHYNTLVWRNTVKRPHPGSFRPGQDDSVPTLTVFGDQSLAYVENFSPSAGSDNRGEGTPYGLDNVDMGTGDDWTELLPFMNGTVESDFFALTEDDILDQNLAHPTGGLWINGQRGALGTSRTNGSYDFTNKAYTTGALSVSDVPSESFDLADPVYIDLSGPFRFNKMSGTITVKRVSDDVIVETYSIPADVDRYAAPGKHVARRYNRLYLWPSTTWGVDQSYYVEVSGVEAMDGTAFAIADSTTWTFSAEEKLYTAIAGTEGFAIDHTMTMPTSYAAGDLVMCFFQVRRAAFVSATAGWSVLENERLAGLHAFVVIAKVMTSSSEPAPVIRVSGNRNSAHVTVKVTSFAGAVATDINKSELLSSSNALPDAGAVTTGWGEGNNLYIWACGSSDGSSDVTAAPVGYVNLVQDGGSANMAVAFKRKSGAGSDSDDPAAATLSVDDRWGAQVYVVEPAL